MCRGFDYIGISLGNKKREELDIEEAVSGNHVKSIYSIDNRIRSGLVDRKLKCFCHGESTDSLSLGQEFEKTRSLRKVYGAWRCAELNVC